jgi:hypothetical protein
MACRHDGYREILTSYDASGGVLVYHWVCETCAERLAEAGRTRYKPSFDPGGNDEFLAGPQGGGEPPALSA